MIVCHCAGVTDSAIARVIEEGAASIADVTRLTGAGRCCAPCRQEIATLLSTKCTAAANLNSILESSSSQPAL
jgi:bacterioferritin-associated ferredoxin